MEPVTGNCGKSTSTEARKSRSYPTALRSLVRLKPIAVQVPNDFEHDLGCLCVTEMIAFYPNYNDTGMVYDNGLWEDVVDDATWTSWVSQPDIAAQLIDVLNSANFANPNALVMNVETRRLYTTNECSVRDFLYHHYANSRGVSLH